MATKITAICSFNKHGVRVCYPPQNGPSTGGITGVGSVNYLTKIITVSGSDIVTIGQTRFYENGTTSHVKNSSSAITFDFENAQINAKSGQLRFDADAGILQKLNGIDVIDIENQRIFPVGSTGVFTPTRINDSTFGNKIYDLSTNEISAFGTPSIAVKIESRELFTSSGNSSFDWENGIATSPTGLGIVNYGLGTISDSSSLSVSFTELTVLGAAQQGSAGQVLTTDGAGTLSWTTVGGGGGGTVTDVSVVSANGFAGTVANSTSTPAITLTTSITGLIKGNGTAISAASASDVTGQLITGYVSGAGTVAATDTILQAIQKLNGNIVAIGTPVTSVSGTANRITSTGGATPVIDIGTDVVTLTGSQALTNKTYNGNTFTAGTGTLTIAASKTATFSNTITFAGTDSTTITMPTATATVLANNLGLSGGTTLIGGTAAGDKIIVQATSNSTHTAAKDLITLRKNSAAAAATSVLMTIGDGQGLNNDEVSIYSGVNTGSSGYLLRAGATFAYFNASSSLRLQIGAADIIQLSSTTATMFQGVTISDAKNIVLNTTTGTKIGTATSQKLGFWNVTPIIQPASANQAAVATTGATNVTPYGFTTAAQADAIVTLVNQLRSDLVAAGLIKGSA